jgi:hypothetical protein
MNAWVVINLTIDQSKYDDIKVRFFGVCNCLGLNNNYFKFESGKRASAMINLEAMEGHSCRYTGYFDE